MTEKPADDLSQKRMLTSQIGSGGPLPSWQSEIAAREAQLLRAARERGEDWAAAPTESH